MKIALYALPKKSKNKLLYKMLFFACTLCNSIKCREKHSMQN